MMDIDDETGLSVGDPLRIAATINNIFGNTTTDHDPLSPSHSGTSNFSSSGLSRGRSKVWNEFVVAPDGKKVICRLCGDSLSYSNSHSTSSMLKHLKRKHRMDLYPPAEDETSKPIPSPKNSEKIKKSNKVKRVTTITNPTEVEPVPTIQHGPLVFTESCVRMRWTDHSEAFLGTFSRFYADECYTDVTLVAEKIFFKAHRVILSSASEYFDDMFKMTPAGQHPIIFLKDVKAMDLRILLDFIYKGEVAIPPSLINELVRIGAEMKVRGLCDFQWNDSMKSSVMNINQPGNLHDTSEPPCSQHQIPVIDEQTDSIVGAVQSQPVSPFPSMYDTFTSTSPTTSVGATMASKLISPTRIFTKQQVQNLNSPLVTKNLNIQPSPCLQKSFSRILSNTRPTSTCISAQVSPIIPNVATLGSTSNGVPALKRFRILASTAAPNKVNLGATRFDLGTGTADPSDLNSSPTVLMVTNEGETVLSTSQGTVTVVPHSNSLDVTPKSEPIVSHGQHLEGHPITLVSHHLGGTTEDLDEVVYSITTSVTGPHGEVLMSNPDEGEVPDTETIVVYGAGEEIHEGTTCESEKKETL